MIYSLYFSLAADSLETVVAQLQQRLPLNLQHDPDNRFYPYRGISPADNARYAITEVYGANDIFLFMTDYAYELEIEVISNEVEQAGGQARAFAGRLFASLKELKKYHLLLLENYGAPLAEYLP
jgi:hypothetical protein